MKKCSWYWLLYIMFSYLICAEAFASITLIITPSPRPQEVIAIPRGYSQCYNVPAGFYNGTWHYQHRVCEYEEGRNARMWIAGYWQCLQYINGGRCTRTSWIRSHWATQNDRRYQQQYRRHAHHNSPYHAPIHNSNQNHIQQHMQVTPYEHGHQNGHQQQFMHGHR